MLFDTKYISTTIREENSEKKTSTLLRTLGYKVPYLFFIDVTDIIIYSKYQALKQNISDALVLDILIRFKFFSKFILHYE